jgi:hypothetical protein
VGALVVAGPAPSVAAGCRDRAGDRVGHRTYAGLLGTSAWRTRSNDASFAALRTHDLRVALPQGSLVTEAG